MRLTVRLQVLFSSQDVATTSIGAHSIVHVYVSGQNQARNGGMTVCVWSAAGAAEICGVVADD